VTPFNDISDDNPQDTFEYVVGQLNPLGLAFLDVLQEPAARPGNSGFRLTTTGCAHCMRAI